MGSVNQLTPKRRREGKEGVRELKNRGEVKLKVKGVNKKNKDTLLSPILPQSSPKHKSQSSPQGTPND